MLLGYVFGFEPDPPRHQDYFSFGLNRSSDYLFEQNLFGRSENRGLFSQQFVISDGGLAVLLGLSTEAGF